MATKYQKISYVIFIVTLLFTSTLCAAKGLTVFDFEDGTLQGWQIIEGNAGTLPTGPSQMRPGIIFNQQGKYFIGLYENPQQDRATIVLKSPEFTIKANTISLLVGGGHHEDECYVALYRAADDSILHKSTGKNAEIMHREYWDVSKYKGERVYLKIVDMHTGGWGHINVDDIREVSEAEEQNRLKEIRVRKEKYKQWLKSINMPSKRRIYTGKHLDAVMPLGALGGGHLGISADGTIRQWAIFNKASEECFIPQSFFAIWAKTKNGMPVARLLQQTKIDNLPCIEKVEFIGEYPIAELTYKDKSLPVKINLKAFSPFIPLNAKDSAIPAVAFEFTIFNESNESIDISLLSSLQNAVGYDGASIVQGNMNKGYGGNCNIQISNNKYSGVLMKNAHLKPESNQYGSMAIASLYTKAKVTTQWDNLRLLWSDFASDGSLDMKSKEGISPAGKTWNTALCIPIKLMPGERITIPIIWCWHFPNNYVWWENTDNHTRIGRMYNNWFKDALDVTSYFASNYCRLKNDTERFRNTFYKTSLPYWMLDRISAQSSTLVSTVCMWLEDGSFAGFEGATACCPMNCTHVWNYEQQMAFLFPEIERIMRNMDLDIQMEANGAIHHRTRLPLSAPRTSGAFTDGQLGTILKAYREYRMSKDRKWLDDIWPKVKRSMEFVLNEWDKNKDGVLVHAQWNTYDSAMYGPNTFIGSLYLCALKACEEMAKIEGDKEFASKLNIVYQSGYERLQKVCWNGEYYWGEIYSRNQVNPESENKWLLNDWPEDESSEHWNRPYGKGCHADQLLGQWWAHILNIGYILPKERVKSSIEAIMKYNWVHDFSEVLQMPRPFAGENDPGLYICTWPQGGKPEQETLYSFEVWTGIEYEVAGLMIYNGLYDDAYKVVKAVSDRYDGIRRPPIARNPWAEVECGNHYARAMAAWSLILAAQGFNYCGPEGTLEFNPVISPNNHKSFFTTAEGWGLFTQTRSQNHQTNTIELEYGKLNLKALRLHLPANANKNNVRVKINKEANIKVEESQNDVIAIMSNDHHGFELKSGEYLRIEFSW